MQKLIILLLFLPILSHAQTKKELIDQVNRQQITIDSLKKVIANFENIVENRDRSIRIIKEDKATLTSEKAELSKIVRQHELTISRLERAAEIGSTKIIQLHNDIAKIRVKEGKYIVINQFISDYSSGISIDSLGQPLVEELHVFFKSINGEVLTDFTKNKLGPQVYSSLHPENTIHFPIILEENAVVEIILMKGPLNDLKPYSGKVLCSFTEKDMN